MALVPDDVPRLTKIGVSVRVEVGAGFQANFPDDAYSSAGANIVPASQLAQTTAIAVVARPPSESEIQALPEASILIGFLDPLRNRELLAQLANHRVTSFALESIPRITRAQSMDALSSMSTIAGYRAVLLAAEASKRMFPMLITAAGTQPPCRVLVLGAGVAGLQALATAKRLGAMTFGFDTRPEVREQVQSVGATFVEMPPELQVEGTEGGYARDVGEEFLRREQEAIGEHLATVDAIITTALIPGKPAPILISEEMIQRMKPGAVIVDLAAEQGGNCELTKAGETVVAHGVTIVGPRNLPAQAATQASQMLSRNVSSFVSLLVQEGNLHLDFDDEIIQGACVTHDGQILK